MCLSVHFMRSDPKKILQMRQKLVEYGIEDRHVSAFVLGLMRYLLINMSPRIIWVVGDYKKSVTALALRSMKDTPAVSGLRDMQRERCTYEAYA